MNKLISFFTIMSLLSSCMLGVQGNGKVKEANRNVKAFENVSISGLFEVHLKQADQSSVRLVADENLHELIETRVEGNTLYISSKESIGSAEELDLYITNPIYKQLQLSGAVSLKSQSELKGDFLEFESSGAAEVDLEVDLDELKMELSGASEIEMRGKADFLSVETSGAAEVKLFQLETEKCRVQTSGAAEVEVNVEDDLQVEASGAADIRYRGNPKLSRTELSGAASLKQD